MNALDAAINVPLAERYREGTAAYAMLARLAPGADLAELPSEHDVRPFGTWTAEKQVELDTVSEQLKRDPREMLRLRTEAKRALEIVKDDIQVVEQGLADAAIGALREAKREAENTRRAAEAAAQELFREQPIPDLGSESWRRMLTYAREFAAAALPDAPPPQFARGGVCVSLPAGSRRSCRCPSGCV